MEKRASTLVIVTLLLTAALVFPMVFLTPARRANNTPGGDVFDLSFKISERMPGADLYTSFIVEARGGDMLTRDALLELFQNEEELRGSDLGRRYLVSRFDVDKSRWNAGIYTIADAVEHALEGHGGLEGATDEMVKVAISDILESEGGSAFKDTFSMKAENMSATLLGRPVIVWSSPAIVVNTYSDNLKVENEYSKTLEGENGEAMTKEHYNRELQSILRGDQRTYRLWGIAIDVNLEAEDEGKVSFMLVFGAVVLILIIVLIIFRSVKVFLLTAIGLVMLLIWMKGLSNLLGLNSSLTIDILVPVSVLVLGVDYVIHVISRYEEVRVNERDPRRALGISSSGVGGALFLAVVTTVVAYASNIVSDIEEIVGFGVAASVAILSAYWIMGFFLPACNMLVDERFGKGKEAQASGKVEGRWPKLMGRSTLVLARWRAVLLPAVLIISVGAGAMALKLEAQLDVKEYFASGSDFVVSLDKVDEHLGDRGGEPAIFYFEGDISDPSVLSELNTFEEGLDDNENIARDQFTGEVIIYMDILGPLRNLLASDYAIGSIMAELEINITDTDGNDIPDTREQLSKVLGYIHDNGIPLNGTTMMYDKAQIRELLWLDPDGSGRGATLVMTGVPGTRELRNVQLSEEEFEVDMRYVDHPSIEEVGLTGSGYERDRTLTAITSSLNLSIALAVVLCFIVLVLVFRSFKFALVTVIPEVLVVCWLYAFMYLGGFHLNAVTATIAAISIGVGIDYSIHIAARYRQELVRLKDREKALETASKNTGFALLGSAISTIVGFALIGFAPMPMFSAYGLLTSVMIVMAFVAAMVVLPSLLFMVTTKKETGA